MKRLAKITWNNAVWYRPHLTIRLYSIRLLLWVCQYYVYVCINTYVCIIFTSRTTILMVHIDPIHRDIRRMLSIRHLRLQTYSGFTDSDKETGLPQRVVDWNPVPLHIKRDSITLIVRAMTRLDRKRNLSSTIVRRFSYNRYDEEDTCSEWDFISTPKP